MTAYSSRIPRKHFQSIMLMSMLFLLATAVFSQRPRIFNDTLPSVHDPVIIKENGTYYIFCTGWGITVLSSTDMKHWTQLDPVFSKPPQWALDAVPGYKGHTWAPDISYHNGQYYLYYSVSAFGKNTSCIGVATNKTLDPSSPDFLWKDHGKVIQSVPGRDDWNAIDPNLVVDEDNKHWLSFGSFWSGIKLVKLDSTLLQVQEPQIWYGIASRKNKATATDTVAGNSAIEAPFIFKHGTYYYLFVSFDYCCRAEKSTYKIMVGRSNSVFGPYVDKDGIPMKLGGGSLVKEGNKFWYGLGHNAVATFHGQDYLIYHAYDANDKGRSKLQIEKLQWQNDWPIIQVSARPPA